MRNILFFLVAAALLHGAQGPVSSNGFQHYVFWNSSDKSFYHVAAQGGVTDTHLVKHYQAYYTARDTVLDSVGSVWYPFRIANDNQPNVYGDTTISFNAGHIIRTLRKDTLFTDTKFDGYSPVVWKHDTARVVYVNTLGRDPAVAGSNIYRGLFSLRPDNFLVVGGRRVRIHERFDYDQRLFVDIKCPTGRNLTVNGTFQTLPCLKMVTSDPESNGKYKLIADPGQPNKLYLFYISDSGRILGDVSHDNGLSWNEMDSTLKNPVLTDTSDHSRASLQAVFSSADTITLSWTGTGTTSTKIGVPLPPDTVIFYVRPGIGNDANFVNETNVANFKATHTVNTPFKSIDRCIHQIVMLENNKTRIQILTLPATITEAMMGTMQVMGVTRAVATRQYIIKMLPGEYFPGTTTDSGVVGYWNKVLFSGWDRSLTVESYYMQPDSYVVVNVANTRDNLAKINYGSIQPDGWGKKMYYDIYHPFQFVKFNRLKVTSKYHPSETPTNACFLTLNTNVATKNVQFTNNLFFSMDSTKYINNRKRVLENIVQCLDGEWSPHYDNFIFINNIFHRIGVFTPIGDGRTFVTQPHDYGAGFVLLNNTFYKWVSGWGPFGTVINKANNIFDGVPSLGGRSRGDDFNYTSGYLDTATASPLFHKIALSSTANTGAYNMTILDSIQRNDFYSIPRSGRDVKGACLPAPDNPLTLTLAEDNTTYPQRSTRVTINHKDLLSGAVDTVRIFRSASNFITNVFSPADTAFSASTMPGSYVSRNTLQTWYYFTIAVGQKTPTGAVNWSYIDIDTLKNARKIKFRDLVPPSQPFSIDTSATSLFVGANQIDFKVLSPIARNPASIREKDVERINLYLFTDSLNFITHYDSSSWSDTARDTFYTYIWFITPAPDTLYADTSNLWSFRNLAPNTRYYIAAVPQDSSGNLCNRDSVAKYIFRVQTKMVPQNVLRVRADTLAGQTSRLAITISGLSAFPAQPILRDSLKLFVRDTGTVTDPYSAVISSIFRDKYINLSAHSGDILYDTIQNLSPDKEYFLSVTIGSVDNYFSRIALDTNTFHIRTPRTRDDSAPSVTGLRLDLSLPASASQRNGLYLQYTLKGLNTITGNDRDSLYVKMMWSTVLDSISNPLQVSGVQDSILIPSQLIGQDSVQGILHTGILPGKLYYVTAFAGDTVPNWSLRTSALTDTLTTPINLSRPVNDVWGVSTAGFDTLKVQIPSLFSTERSSGTTDSNDIAEVGIWVLDVLANVDNTTDFNAIVNNGGVGLDVRHKLIRVDSAEMNILVDTAVLTHNKTYYIACAPRNAFGNWGKVTLGSSLFKVTTPFDYTKITKPVNLCSLAVSRMRDPDSVKVYYRLPSYQYYDAAVFQQVQYDSVLIYYRNDGTYPQVSLSGITGTRLCGYKITNDPLTYANVVPKSVSVIGEACNTAALRFGAFLVNTVPVGGSNRISDPAARAQSGPVTPPCAPVNQLQVTADATGGSAKIQVTCKWTGSLATRPDQIRLLYKIVTDTQLTPPSSYADGKWFEDYPNTDVPALSWNPQNEATFLLTKNIGYRDLYLVAAFNAGADTVWSKTPLSGLPGMQWDTARMPPPDDQIAPQNALTLSAHAVNSRAIRMLWNDPQRTLAAIQTSERGHAALYYRYKTAPSADYSTWIKIVDSAVVDSAVAHPLDTNYRIVSLEGDRDPSHPIQSNRTYYLVIAPGDSVNPANVVDTHALARDTVTLVVPKPDADSIFVNVLSDTAFSVNFSALCNDVADAVNQDSNLVAGLVLVSDSARLDSNFFDGFTSTDIQNIINGDEVITHSSRSPSSHTFLSKVVTLKGGQEKIIGAAEGDKLDLINLNKRHYISFVLRTSSGDVSKPVFVDSIQYYLRAPHFKSLSVSQVNSDYVKVSFMAADSEDAVLGLNVRYAINDTSCQNPKDFIGAVQLRSGYYALRNDNSVAPESLYTAYLKLSELYTVGSQLRYCFKNNDTTRITLKFELSDLMGSVPSAADVTVLKTVRVDTKVPSPVVVFQDSAAPAVFRVSLKGAAGDLDTIRYALTDGTDYPSFVRFYQDTVLDFQNAKVVRLRFLDSLGNRCDTAWRYFGIGEPGHIAQYQEPVYYFDNGGLGLRIENYSFTDRLHSLQDTLYYYLGKDTVPSLVRNIQGLTYSAPNSYFFEWVQKTLDSAAIWRQGVSIYLRVDTMDTTLDLDNTFIYRYNKATGQVYYVGGRYNGGGYIVADSVHFPTVHDTTGDQTADSIFFFLAKDTQRVSISQAGLTYDTLSHQLKLSLNASDNTQSLYCKVEVFTYDSLHNAKVIDSMVITESPLVRSGVVLPVTVSRTDLLRGVFVAIRATDQDTLRKSRFVFSYSRCGYTADSISLNFRGVNEYQLISLPYQLPAGESDALYAMKAFSGGKYDKTRFRLYRVDAADNSISEFSADELGKDGVDADEAFQFKPGSAYFLKTRYFQDNTVPVVIKNASLPQLDDATRGYRIASATKDGWYVFASPFIGNVKISLMEKFSVLMSPLVKKRLNSRLFVLDIHGNWTLISNDQIQSESEYGQGFLVYLYAGEALYMPVVRDTAMAPASTVSAKAASSAEPSWSARLLLHDGAGQSCGNYTEIGLTGSGEDVLPALPAMTDRASLSLEQGKHNLCREIRRLSKNGEVWSVRMAGPEGDYTLLLEGFAQGLPAGWKVVVENGEGYVMNLQENNGAFPFYLKAGQSRLLRVLAGDPEFLEKNIKQPSPKVFELSQNYPNPFNPVTRIKLSIPVIPGMKSFTGSRAKVDIFDARGRLVRRVFEDVAMPGYRSIVWDGRSDNGRSVASGIYIYRTVVQDASGRERFAKSLKMMLTR